MWAMAGGVVASHRAVPNMWSATQQTILFRGIGMKEQLLGTMRSQAWERAKGEMKSMLYTYIDYDGDKFARFSEELKRFIDSVEDHGLQE